MVDVVTKKQAEQQHVATVQGDEVAAAEAMAREARERAEEDTTVVEETTNEETSDWDDLLEDDVEEDEVPEDLAVEEEAEVATEEVPEEVVETTEEVPAEETAEVETEIPEVEIPTEEVSTDTRTPEQVKQEIAEAREMARDKLVDSFQLTEEQTELFAEDPGAVLANLAADLYLDIFDSVSNGLRSQMPGMLQGLMQQQKAQAAHEQSFYGAWPQLAKAEYKPTIDRITAAFRQQNPNIDSATAVQEIGAQAWVALRLPLEGLVEHTRAHPDEPAQVQQVRPNHVPASAGNTTQNARAPAQPKMNEFEQLAAELIDDDDF